jgi:hypothetical protein
MVEKSGYANRRELLHRALVALVLAGFAPDLGAQTPATSAAAATSAVAATSAASAGSATSATSADTYRVTWKEGPRAEVDAWLHSPTCTFSTAKKWATFFDDGRGWNRFHANLRATDLRGRPVAPAPQAPKALGDAGAASAGSPGSTGSADEVPGDFRVTGESSPPRTTSRGG